MLILICASQLLLGVEMEVVVEVMIDIEVVEVMIDMEVVVVVEVGVMVGG